MWAAILADAVTGLQSASLPSIWARAGALLYFLLDGTHLPVRFREAQRPCRTGLHPSFSALAQQHVPQALLHGGCDSAGRFDRRRFIAHRGADLHVYRTRAGAELLQDPGTVWVALTHGQAGFVFHGAGTRPRAHQPDGGGTQCVRYGQRAWLHESDGAD